MCRGVHIHIHQVTKSLFFKLKSYGGRGVEYAYSYLKKFIKMEINELPWARQHKDREKEREREGNNSGTDYIYKFPS